MRALQEELGIATDQSAIQLADSFVIDKDSATFGGMQTQILVQPASVELTQKQFRPDGYVEHTDEKDVYFVWEMQEL